MIAFLATLISLVHLTYGQAAYYSEGVFQDVVRMRQSGNTAMSLPREVPPFIGLTASPHCEEVGNLVWIFYQGELAGPYWIADCCIQDNGDCDRMKSKNIVAEVDFNTAMRWKVVGLGPEFIDVVVIRSAPPPTPVPVEKVESPSFLPMSEYERSLSP